MRPPWRTCLILTGVLVAQLACGLGCDDDRSVRTYQTAKETPPPASPFGSAQNSALTDAPAPTITPPTWTLPAGWKLLPPPTDETSRKMEAARISVSADSPKAILTLVIAGGTITSNVARWEGQLHLPISSTPEDVAKLMTELDTPFGPTYVVDLASPAGTSAPQRIVSAILPRSDLTWFVTLKGPADAVGKQRRAFDQFVSSLRFSDNGPAADAPPSASPPATSPAAGGAGETLTYRAPADWKPAPADNDMRVLGFSAGPAMVAVDQIPASGMGNLPAIVNMWRGQIGLPSLSGDQAVKPDGAVTIDGHVGVLFDLTGPAGEAGAPGKRLIISMTTIGDSDWFIKLTGPADAVAAQKSAFLSFMQSIHFVAGVNSGGGG